VLGFHARHPDWTQRQIADAMSVNQKTVHNLLSVEEVKRVVPFEDMSSKGTAPNHIRDSHLREVASAPQELWEPLVKEAEENKWTVKETQAQVQQVDAVHAAPQERSQRNARARQDGATRAVGGGVRSGATGAAGTSWARSACARRSRRTPNSSACWRARS